MLFQGMMLVYQTMLKGMVIGVVKFSSGGVQNWKDQHTQRKLLNFENWCIWEVSKIGYDFRK